MQFKRTPHGGGLNKVSLAKWLDSMSRLRPGSHIDGLYADPAWNILLDLYIHENAGVRTSVSAACISSQAPPTTALRYLATLTEHRFIRRTPDETDRRRHWLSLTENTATAMDDYFERILTVLRDLLASDSSDVDLGALAERITAAVHAIRQAEAAMQPLERWTQQRPPKTAGRG